MTANNGSQTVHTSSFLTKYIWIFIIYPVIFIITLVVYHQIMARDYSIISMADVIGLISTRGFRNFVGASFLSAITLCCMHFIRQGGKAKIYSLITLLSIALLMVLYQTGLVMFESFAEFKPTLGYMLIC